jgi:hypothetical protein
MVRRYLSTNSTVLLSTKSRQHFNAKLIFGPPSTQSYPEDFAVKLNSCREIALNAAKMRDYLAFENSCFTIMKELPKLPRNHKLFFPNHLTFLRDPSPVFTALRTGLKVVFMKICDIVGESDPQPNNSGGLAFEAVRGAGKSNLLRILALFPKLLFPNNVITAYIDYASYSQRQFSPRELINSALLEDGVCGQNGVKEYLENVLDETSAQSKVVVFCADELEHVYGNAEIWADFHTLATSYDTSLFVADSGSKLRAMIEKRGYENKLREWFPEFRNPDKELPCSLNSDKLAIVQISTLSTREQYAAHAKHVGNPFVDIEGAHILSGGRFRALSRIGDNARNPTDLPLPGSVERFVLQRMADQQSDEGFRPFNLASWTENDICSWVASWKVENSSLATDADLSSLLDACIIARHPIRTGRYTFATPYMYILLRNLNPRVFTSHACSTNGLKRAK